VVCRENVCLVRDEGMQGLRGRVKCIMNGVSRVHDACSLVQCDAVCCSVLQCVVVSRVHGGCSLRAAKEISLNL